MIKIKKDSYRGEKCFIVASGPSIKNMDLSCLKNEIVICVNESYKALSFPPSFICIGDHNLWPLIKDVYAKIPTSIICTTGLDGTCGSEYGGKNMMGLITLDKTKSITKHGFSFDLIRGVSKGYNVVLETALPFVCWAGFSDCYLLGCDCTNTGYFYDDPIRGKEYQKVDDRAIFCFTAVSKQKLPTRIWNSTIGGNLEVFPRRSLKDALRPGIMPEDLVVVGYYTPDRNYKALAENMQRSVQKQGLACFIYERPSAYTSTQTPPPKPMPWVLNCAICSSFIFDMIKKFPDKHILYLDADATMERRPSLFFDKEVRYDFAAPFLTNNYVTNELQSNTLFFKNTPAAKRLVMEWMHLQSQRNRNMLENRYLPPYREAWDQKVLQDAMERVPDIKWAKLPWTYGKLDPTQRGEELMPGIKPEDVVISQHQASRQNKKEV